MLDQSKIGTEFPSQTVRVETGRLKFFAKAIGETNPVYLDELAALNAGYRALPAPPTFPFSLDLESDSDLPPEVELLAMDIGRILHGGQDFEYFGQIYAGDEITVNRELVDIYQKKNGALEFVVVESRYHNQEGRLMALARATMIYRNDDLPK